MRQVVVVCALLVLWTSAESSEAQCEPCEPCEKRVLGDQRVDHAFREAVRKVERNAEEHFGKLLLEGTFNKLNKQATDKLKAEALRHMQNPQRDEDPKITALRASNQKRLAAATAMIKSVSKREDKVEEGVDKLRAHVMAYNVQDEWDSALVRHARKVRADRAAEKALALAQNARTPEHAVRQGQAKVHELSQTVDEMKASIKEKCFDMKAKTKQQLMDVDSQLRKVISDKDQAEAKFQTASDSVDLAVVDYSNLRKEARAATSALNKAEVDLKTASEKVVKAVQSASSKKAKETDEVSAEAAKDTVLAARDRVAKMRSSLLAGQKAVEKSLGKLSATKSKLVQVTDSVAKHSAFKRSIQDHSIQIQHECALADGSAPHPKPVIHSAIVSVNSSVKVSQILNETLSFAQQAQDAASKIRAQAAQALNKPHVNSTSNATSPEELAMAKLTAEAHRMTKQADMEVKKIQNSTQQQISLGDGLVTEEMCDAAKSGMKMLCKKHGENSQECSYAQDLFSNQC